MAPEVILNAESSLVYAIIESGNNFQNTTKMINLSLTIWINKHQQDSSRLIINETYFYCVFCSGE